MQPVRSVSVSELKNTLLEVVRRVERGEAFEITKAGLPVARLSPLRPPRPATGFSRVEIKGSLDLPEQDWSYDVDNLSPPRKKR